MLFRSSFESTKLYNRVMSRASSYKIEKDSGDSVCSGFDLFEVLPTNTAILQGEDEEYQLLSGGSEEGEVEWSVPGLDAVVYRESCQTRQN